MNDEQKYSFETIVQMLTHLKRGIQLREGGPYVLLSELIAKLEDPETRWNPECNGFYRDELGRSVLEVPTRLYYTRDELGSMLWNALDETVAGLSTPADIIDNLIKPLQFVINHAK